MFSSVGALRGLSLPWRLSTVPVSLNFSNNLLMLRVIYPEIVSSTVLHYIPSNDIIFIRISCSSLKNMSTNYALMLWRLRSSCVVTSTLRRLNNSLELKSQKMAENFESRGFFCKLCWSGWWTKLMLETGLYAWPGLHSIRMHLVRKITVLCSVTLPETRGILRSEKWGGQTSVYWTFDFVSVTEGCYFPLSELIFSNVFVFLFYGLIATQRNVITEARKNNMS